MNEKAAKTIAVVSYIEGKLPEGWGIHCPAGKTYNKTGMNNYFLALKRLENGKTLGVPFIVNMENTEQSAKDALNTVWGLHEQGYEVWNIE